MKDIEGDYMTAFDLIDAQLADLRNAVKLGEADHSAPQRVDAVKLGDYIKRKPNAKRVWIRGAYHAGSKTYELQAADDMNAFLYVNGSAVVWTGFSY